MRIVNKIDTSGIYDKRIVYLFDGNRTLISKIYLPIDALVITEL